VKTGLVSKEAVHSLFFSIKLEHPVSFAAFNLHDSILPNLEALGYDQPTPIQAESLPRILAGQDLIGLAQTGTGKTAAFVLPILQRLLQAPKRGQIRALILVPTRELAEQIHQEFGKLGKGSRLRGLPLYGGKTSVYQQIEQLRKGVEIAIACPGRLLDHLARGSINLEAVEMLVLDEADLMLDMGFFENIQKILTHLPIHPKRQSLLFSATMSRDVVKLAKTMLVQPEMVQVDPIAPTHTVSQDFYPVSESLKETLLLKLLPTLQAQAVLVFTRTKQRAIQLAEQLNQQGFKAGDFQGDLSQYRRQRLLDQFRFGKLPILVATDIASRGIDVASISHVINFDMPNTVDIYTHRIGRTGRANSSGKALSFVTNKTDRAHMQAVMRLSKEKIIPIYLPDFEYRTAAPPAGQQARQGFRSKQYTARKSAVAVNSRRKVYRNN
jgi:ATP-dependent RNA helicase RhlE